MPGNYTGAASGVSSWPLVISEPADGDSDAAATFNPAFSKLADAIQNNFEAAAKVLAQNWTKNTGPTGFTNYLAIGAYEDTGGAARWVALVGDAGKTALSGSSGLIWSAASAVGAQNYTVVRGLNGIFLAGGLTGVLATSVAGGAFTARTSNTANAINDFTWNGNTGAPVYVGVTVNGDTIRSTDGTTWVKTAIGGGVTFLAVAFGVSKYVAVRGDRHVYTSADGTSWTDQGTALAASFVPNQSATRFAAGLFVCLGVATNLKVAWSADGITWTTVDLGVAGSTDAKLVWTGRFWLILTALGAGTITVFVSPDGKTWTKFNHPAYPVGATATGWSVGTFSLAALQTGALAAVDSSAAASVALSLAG
jgi:hypothetical protein